MEILAVQAAVHQPVYLVLAVAEQVFLVKVIMVVEYLLLVEASMLLLAVVVLMPLAVVIHLLVLLELAEVVLHHYHLGLAQRVLELAVTMLAVVVEQRREHFYLH
jgi:hypothetical protein